jgi:hypothetical protein
MAKVKTSKQRFVIDEDTSPREVVETRKENGNDLGLTQVDSSFAIGQAGGVVVVMQELHDESAFDTGDFAVSKSRFDKRKDAQKEREDAIRRKKEEERRAAIASKKEEEARAAREAANAKEAARKAAEEEKRKKAREDRKQARIQKKKEEKEEKESRGPVPAPPPAPTAAAATQPKSVHKDRPLEAAPLSEASKAILQDSAVVGIGNVISTKKPVSAPVILKLIDASAQTDPVRILPIEQSPKVASSTTSAAAAWWLQQATGPAQPAQPPPQQPQTQAPPQPSGDQYMMQAYIDAMQRMTAPAQPSSYGYWTAPAAQAPSAADMYWQQQQQHSVYQSAPRYTAPRRIP